MNKRREIQMYKPNFFEVDTIPTEGTIVFEGPRRELVVEDVPRNSEQGHLIRTAYLENGEPFQNTYLVEIRARFVYTLTPLGSAKGPKISELYSEKLTEAEF